MFEPFFRVDKSRSRGLGGVGLGLALVREIVRVHDGSITVKSNPSGGTILRCYSLSEPVSSETDCEYLPDPNQARPLQADNN